MLDLSNEYRYFCGEYTNILSFPFAQAFPGFTQQIDKLVFVGLCPKLPVIASQCAHWRGNPPVRGEMYRKEPERMGDSTIFGGNRYPVPFNRGIATTSLRTGLAMTALFFKHQFAALAGRKI